jgi:hypothetical protein
MKITKDLEANAAYIYLLSDNKDIRVDYTLPIIDEET